MVGPTLPEREAQRARLYADLVPTGDFRRGALTATYRQTRRSGQIPRGSTT